MPTIGSDGIWPIWDLMNDWWTTSEFIPYWDENAPASADAHNVFASTYLKKGKEALIVVGNWNFEPAETNVSINYAALGLATPRVRIVDALTPAEIKPASGPLQLRLGARDLRVLRVHTAK
jgi:maltose-binding protein MalE